MERDAVVHDFEVRLRRRDGTTIWVQDSARVVHAPDDKARVLYYEGSVRDITERKRAEIQLKRRHRELEVLASVSASLRRAQTRDELRSILVAETVEVLQADAGTLILLEASNEFGRGEDTLVFAAGCGPSEALVGQQHLPGDDPLWKVVRTGEPSFVPDVAELSEFSSGGIHRTLVASFAACAIVPLQTAEATVGLLHLAARSHREWPEEERQILTAVAEIAGNALHRMSIMETLEQRVVQRTRELEALYEVAAVASMSQGLQPTLERSLEVVLAAMQSNVGAIHLLDETRETLHLAAHQGGSADILAQIVPGSSNSPSLIRLIEHGEPLVIPDIATDSYIPEAVRTSDLQTYVGAPLRAGRQVLGVLSVARQRGQPFGIEEAALLASIADQVGLTVENARLYQQAEQLAVMEERQRLARELHDSVTQALYSLTLFTRTGQYFAAAGEIERVAHYLDRIGATGHQALKEMRLLIHELRPQVLEQEGLVGALQQRLDAVEQRAGVEVRLLAADVIELPAPVEEGLYRIAQEALNNALKHAAATSVRVHLRTGGEQVVLEVVDNGCGFDPDAVSGKGGLGLASMRERAEQLGASLTVESTPGEGTRVIVNCEL